MGADVTMYCKAFYLPASDRSNLTVLASAHVHSIPTQTTGNGDITAVGVQFEVAGELYMANAIREVIVSGGSVAHYLSPSPSLSDVSVVL